MNPIAALTLAFGLAACAAQPPEAAAAGDSAQLIGPTWGWTGTLYGDDRKVEVADPARFTLTFRAGGRVEVRADCNRGGASYTADAHTLAFGPVALTKMMCERGSPDRDFLRGLEAAQGWLTKDGELFVVLKLDTGTMRFKPL